MACVKSLALEVVGPLSLHSMSFVLACEHVCVHLCAWM